MAIKLFRLYQGNKFLIGVLVFGGNVASLGSLNFNLDIK